MDELVLVLVLTVTGPGTERVRVRELGVALVMGEMGDSYRMRARRTCRCRGIH